MSNYNSLIVTAEQLKQGYSVLIKRGKGFMDDVIENDIPFTIIRKINDNIYEVEDPEYKAPTCFYKGKHNTNIYCPYCEQSFLDRQYNGGECPLCRHPYFWYEDCASDYSDCWDAIEWE